MVDLAQKHIRIALGEPSLLSVSSSQSSSSSRLSTGATNNATSSNPPPPAPYTAPSPTTRVRAARHAIRLLMGALRGGSPAGSPLPMPASIEGRARVQLSALLTVAGACTPQLGAGVSRGSSEEAILESEHALVLLRTPSVPASLSAAVHCSASAVLGAHPRRDGAATLLSSRCRTLARSARDPIVWWRSALSSTAQILHRISTPSQVIYSSSGGPRAAALFLNARLAEWHSEWGTPGAGSVQTPLPAFLEAQATLCLTQLFLSAGDRSNAYRALQSVSTLLSVDPLATLLRSAQEEAVLHLRLQWLILNLLAQTHCINTGSYSTPRGMLDELLQLLRTVRWRSILEHPPPPRPPHWLPMAQWLTPLALFSLAQHLLVVSYPSSPFDVRLGHLERGMAGIARHLSRFDSLTGLDSTILELEVPITLRLSFSFLETKALLLLSQQRFSECASVLFDLIVLQTQRSSDFLWEIASLHMLLGLFSASVAEAHCYSSPRSSGSMETTLFSSASQHFSMVEKSARKHNSTSLSMLRNWSSFFLLVLQVVDRTAALRPEVLHPDTNNDDHSTASSSPTYLSLKSHQLHSVLAPFHDSLEGLRSKACPDRLFSYIVEVLYNWSSTLLSAPLSSEHSSPNQSGSESLDLLLNWIRPLSGSPDENGNPSKSSSEQDLSVPDRPLHLIAMFQLLIAHLLPSSDPSTDINPESLPKSLIKDSKETSLLVQNIPLQLMGQGPFYHSPPSPNSASEDSALLLSRLSGAVNDVLSLPNLKQLLNWNPA